MSLILGIRLEENLGMGRLFFNLASGLALVGALGPVNVQVESRVDINHASVAELMRVPGMTAVWAGRIVRFRPYRTKLDLLNEGVVSAEVYGRIKDGVVARRVGSTGNRD